MPNNQETQDRPQERAQERAQDKGGGAQPSAGRSPGSRGAPRPLRIQERGKEAYREAQALASTLEQAIDEIGQFLREQAEKRPYVSVATAAGIGYVLGGGVPSRLTGFVFGLGSRFAIEMFLRELIGGATGAGSSGSPSNEAHRSVS